MARTLPLSVPPRLNAMVPALIGANVYVGLSPLAFRRVVLSLLSLSGMAMLATSVPRVLP